MVHANFRAISEVILNVSETTLTKMKRISVKRWSSVAGKCNIIRENAISRGEVE